MFLQESRDHLTHQMMFKGALKTHDKYEKFLNEILNIQEKLNPLSHIKKFEIIKGDAVKEFPKYILKNQHTIISLAYFDFDIYEPTKELLKLIKPRLVRGSVLAFDELNDPTSWRNISSNGNFRVKQYSA